MLKFLHIARISNFCTFLVDFGRDFKHVVLFLLNELLTLPFMVRKLEMSSFQPNLNRKKIPPITLDIFQTVHEDVI
jgi:hypothetical protein